MKTNGKLQRNSMSPQPKPIAGKNITESKSPKPKPSKTGKPTNK